MGWQDTSVPFHTEVIHHAEQVGGVVDGRSFVNLLRGEQDASRQDRTLIWHFPNNWGPRIGPSSVIRLGDWKLIYYHVYGWYSQRGLYTGDDVI